MTQEIVKPIPIKQPVTLKLVIEAYMPYNDGSGNGDMGMAEKFIDLTPLVTNVGILKDFKKMLLDMKDLIKKHDARPRNIIMPQGEIIQ